MESTTDKLDLSSGEAQKLVINEAAPPQGANVTLTFDETVVVPTTSTTIQVNMFDGGGNKAISAYTTAVDPQALQDITVAGVPTNVAAIELLWLDESAAACGSHHITEIPELAIGETAIVTVSGQADMDTSDLNLTILNAWNEKSLTAADVHVSYKSECASAGEATVAGTLDGNTCTAKFTGLLGKKVEVLSVTLFNQATSVPFEWLSYVAAQPVSEEKLTLDVEANEFAGGSGTAEDPYLLANPRQFYNIGDHLDASYQQIADIDFAGSCGITIKEDGSVDTSDDTARYYHDGEGYKPIAPAVETDPTYFTGTYDGAYEGKNFAIRNMVAYFKGTEGLGVALFGMCKDGTFKNVTIDETCSLSNVELTISYSASLALILCSSEDGFSSLDNCTSKARIVSSGEEGAEVGGLVYMCSNYDGACTAYFKDCSFAGSMQGNITSGGLVGSACLTSGCYFLNCVNNGTLSGELCLGGIVGSISSSGTADNPVTFTNCVNHGDITASDVDCGGIVGFVDYDCILKFDACVNTGSLAASAYVGGLAGEVGNVVYAQSCEKLTIINCHCSSGNLSAGSQGMGGLVGSMYATELELSGSNEVSCTFDLSDTVTEVGGIFGKAKTFVGKETELQAILKGKVTVSEDCLKSIPISATNYRGAYCGNPWINTL